jgi:hypothetical protein
MIVIPHKPQLSLIGLLSLLAIASQFRALDAPVVLTSPRLAVVTAVRGDVERWDHSQAAWEPLAMGETLTGGDQIRTGVESAIVVQFEDGAILRLAPDSQFSLAQPRSSPDGRLACLKTSIRRLWVVLTGAPGLDDVYLTRGVASVRG